MRANDSNIFIAANKVIEGINKFEVFVEEKSSKKLGFFEKIFHYFAKSRIFCNITCFQSFITANISC